MIIRDLAPAAVAPSATPRATLLRAAPSSSFRAEKVGHYREQPWICKALFLPEQLFSSLLIHRHVADTKHFIDNHNM